MVELDPSVAVPRHQASETLTLGYKSKTSKITRDIYEFRDKDQINIPLHFSK